jgi:hypothetical protein
LVGAVEWKRLREERIVVTSFSSAETINWRYYVHVPSRIQRDDVAGGVPELPDWVTRFSGFDFVADLQHLQRGEYRLGVVHETEAGCDEFVFANRLRVVS